MISKLKKIGVKIGEGILAVLDVVFSVILAILAVLAIPFIISVIVLVYLRVPLLFILMIVIIIGAIAVVIYDLAG